MKMYVGLDLGLQKTAVCCINENGAVVYQKIIRSEADALVTCFATHRDEIELVGLEACPLSEWLHGALTDAGFNAICLETRPPKQDG